MLKSTFAPALEDARFVSQYGHISYNLRDGTFAGTPTSIAQTPDGYIWIGTRAGVMRFDGARFVPLPLPVAEHLLSVRVLALHAARDGSLWIGTRADLERWQDGHLTHITDVLGQINSIDEDAQGRIWFTRSHFNDSLGPLCEATAQGTRCQGSAAGITDRYLLQFRIDTQGIFWIAGDNDIVRYAPGQPAQQIAVTSTKQTWDTVQSIAPAADGTVWISAMQPKLGLGLLKLRDGRLQSFQSPELDGRTLACSALLVDSHQAVWVGTQGAGVYRIYQGTVDHFGRREGLASDTVQELFEDREHNLWILTTQSVEVLRDLRVASVSSREGLSADLVNGVLPLADGSVLINNWHSLDRIEGRHVNSGYRSASLPGEEVNSMFEDNRRRLWLGIDTDLTVLENGRFRRIRLPDGSPVGAAQAFAQTPSGDIWVIVTGTAGPNQGWLVRLHEARIVEQISQATLPFSVGTHGLVADAAGGLWLALKNGDLAHRQHGQTQVFSLHRSANQGAIRTLIATDNGGIIGATPLGLVGWHAGETRTLTLANGLPCQEIHAVLEDRHQALWLYSACGLLRIPPEDVRRWWNDPAVRVHFGSFGAADGPQPALAAFFPTAARAPDGRLWFANGSVAQVVDPEHLTPNTLPPPIRIEELIADQQPFAPRAGLRLPALTRNLEIHYTALSFSNPRKVLFRYRLEGRDPDWQEVGTRRQAIYTDLPPGHYRFHVQACNNDGLWNSTGSTLEFEVAAAVYQTWWFVALCVLAGVLFVVLLFTRRVRQIQAVMRLRMEVRIAERERIARELHDTFLQGVQGLLLKLQAALYSIPSTEPGRVQMEAALQSATDVLAEGRDRVWQLREPQRRRLNLPETLETTGRELAAAYGVEFISHVVQPARAIPYCVAEELAAICREALINAFKHGHPAKVSLSLRGWRRGLRVRITDDGRGFDPDTAPSVRDGHFGLSGMRERARKIRASLTLYSRPGAGCTLELALREWPRENGSPE